MSNRCIHHFVEDLQIHFDCRYENERPSFDEIFSIIVKLISYRSTCVKTPQAALLIKDNRILSLGYNGVAAGNTHCKDEEVYEIDNSGSCKRCIHAEHNCLGFASRNGVVTDGCTLYVTMPPCINCAKLVVAAGIKKYKYLEEYRLTEGKEFLVLNKVQVTKL